LATSELLKWDSGIFVAPPGSGKTVVACDLISERNTSTLVLVHKQPLIDQWSIEIIASLGLDVKQIGFLGGSKRKRRGIVDIAMLQSLFRSQECSAILSQYGLVVIDECHHVPASSFEAVMKQCASRYVLGLTATPRRKDSLEVLLYQQCGPIRDEIRFDELSSCSKSVTVRDTGFRLPETLGANPPYHRIAQLISTDESRNRLIANDILVALHQGRFPVVLADRLDQIKTLQTMVIGSANGSVETFCLEGAQSSKRRRQVLTDIDKAKAGGRPAVLLATASLIGEGFNLPELDTLFLASPISFEGRLIQYVGRLQRSAAGKDNVIVFDYVDESCAVLHKMYHGRIKTYQKLGYEIPLKDSITAGDQPRLF
jgi:superfamily II DNA or RNA helicase